MAPDIGMLNDNVESDIQLLSHSSDHGYYSTCECQPTTKTCGCFAKQQQIIKLIAQVEVCILIKIVSRSFKL
jgi:hypothetical protein